MARKTFFCVDAHTCGNPVRVVAGGGPNLIGANMSEKRQHFLREYCELDILYNTLFVESQFSLNMESKKPLAYKLVLLIIR